MGVVTDLMMNVIIDMSLVMTDTVMEVLIIIIMYELIL